MSNKIDDNVKIHNQSWLHTFAFHDITEEEVAMCPDNVKAHTAQNSSKFFSNNRNFY